MATVPAGIQSNRLSLTGCGRRSDHTGGGTDAFTSRGHAVIWHRSILRRLDVRYGRFCADPGAIWDQITQRLRAQGMSMTGHTPATAVSDTNQCRLSAGDTQAVLDTYRRLSPVID